LTKEAALASPVAAVNLRPVDQLVADAAAAPRGGGKAFEELVGVLCEELRKGIGDFPPSERSNGYWDPSDTEIDLAALNASGPGDPAGLLQTLCSGAGP
jgi:hypothetical protein